MAGMERCGILGNLSANGRLNFILRGVSIGLEHHVTEACKYTHVTSITRQLSPKSLGIVVD